MGQWPRGQAASSICPTLSKALVGWDTAACVKRQKPAALFEWIFFFPFSIKIDKERSNALKIQLEAAAKNIGDIKLILTEQNLTRRYYFISIERRINMKGNNAAALPKYGRKQKASRYGSHAENSCHFGRFGGNHERCALVVSTLSYFDITNDGKWRNVQWGRDETFSIIRAAPFSFQQW